MVTLLHEAKCDESCDPPSFALIVRPETRPIVRKGSRQSPWRGTRVNSISPLLSSSGGVTNLSNTMKWSFALNNGGDNPSGQDSVGQLAQGVSGDFGSNEGISSGSLSILATG